MNATFPLPLGLPALPAELAALGAYGPVEVNPNDIVRQAFRIGHMRLLAPFATASYQNRLGGRTRLRHWAHRTLPLIAR
jgi:hypothetical protein